MMAFDGDFTMITNDSMRFYGDFMVIQWEISREIFTIPVTTSSDHRIISYPPRLPKSTWDSVKFI